MNDEYRGCHKKGIKRYSKLVQIVNSNRETAKSKKLEIKLKSIYAKLCGKGKEAYNSDEKRQDIDSDSKNDDLKGLMVLQVI